MLIENDFLQGCQRVCFDEGACLAAQVSEADALARVRYPADHRCGLKPQHKPTLYDQISRRLVFAKEKVYNVNSSFGQKCNFLKIEQIIVRELTGKA